MAYIKLEGKFKEFVDKSYELEKQALDLIDEITLGCYPNRNTYKWIAISKTDIEKSFMSLRKAISEGQKINDGLKDCEEEPYQQWRSKMIDENTGERKDFV